jgi:hypothetical protein
MFMESEYKGWNIVLTPKADSKHGQPHNDICLEDPTGLEVVHLSDGSAHDSRILAEKIIDELVAGFTRKDINDKYKGWQIILTAKADSGDWRPHTEIILKDPEGLEFARLSDGSNQNSKVLAKGLIDDIEEAYRKR